MDAMKLEALARRIEACVEDARRPTPMPHLGAGIVQPPSAAIASLSYALEAIAIAIRAETDPGIPIHPTALVEKGIPGLATIHDATDDVLGKDGG